jgi:coenzyme F420-reducing hydrogenase gamma subunit
VAKKLKIAVWKFASCDGCQLSLLDCEDELLAVADAVEIAYFPEATSTMKKGPYDVSIVEGSVTTPHDAARIREVRSSSKLLVTIGACATSGGVQALRNFRSYPDMLKVVYARPDFIDALATSTPIADHVPVDFELRGCPINKHQLLDVLTALVHGRTPHVPKHAVCVECKLRGHVCVMVAHGTPCLGPVTHAGCGALCPGFSRGCYGCYGPNDAPQTAPLARRFLAQGVPAADVGRMFLTFNANASAFRDEGFAHGGDGASARPVEGIGRGGDHGPAEHPAAAPAREAKPT